MKKIILFYLICLFGIFIVFSQLDQKSDYVIERKLWKIHKKYVEIAQDPSTISSEHFEKVIKQYERIIASYPSSRLIKGVELLIAELYTFKKDYAKAREKYAFIQEHYSADQELVAEAIFRVGKTYELEGHWPQALQIYLSLQDQHPLTAVGLSTPVYIANNYSRKNMLRETMDAYEKAIVFYRKIAAEHPNSRFEFDALRYLANCFLDQNRWGEALETLEAALLEYNTPEYLNEKRVGVMIHTISIISDTRVHDKNRAVLIYEKFLEANPGHPFKKYFLDAIASLKK